MTKKLEKKLKAYWEECGKNESIFYNFINNIISTSNYNSLEGSTTEEKVKILLDKWKSEELKHNSPKAGYEYICIYVPNSSFIYKVGQKVKCNEDGLLAGYDYWDEYSDKFKKCFDIYDSKDIKGLNLQKLEERIDEILEKDDTEPKHKGLRFNEGKLRYDLVHPYAHEQMVRVLTRGAEKYAERNWERGMAWSNVIASLKRHLACIEKGEDYDSETGELHAAHLACNAHFLTAYYKIYPQGDDRPHSYLNRPKIGLDIDEVIADWVGAWTEKHGMVTPEFWNFDTNIQEKFEQIKNDKDFWMSIKPRINPKDLPFEPHCYITSRPIPTEWTQEWIEKNGFPTMPVYTVGYEESKVEVAKKSGIDIFVDDRYENFVELNQAGICTFLMSAPHNQRYDCGFKRIKDLKELV